MGEDSLRQSLFFYILVGVLTFLGLFLSALFYAPAFLLTCVVARSKERVALVLTLTGIGLTLYKNLAILLAFNTQLNEPWTLSVAQILLGSDVICFALAGGLAISSIGIRALPKGTGLLVGVLSLLLLYGLATSGLGSALVYGRTFALPFIMVVIGMYLGRRHESTIVGFIWVMLLIYCSYLVLELAVSDLDYLLDVGRFGFFKYQRILETDQFLSLMGTNLLGLNLTRVIGPQMHPISVGYTLGVLLLLVLESDKIRGGVRLALIVFCLVGGLLASKGAFLLNLVLLVGYFFTRKKPALILILAIGYSVALLLISPIMESSARDHYLGLLTGIAYFLTHPLGSGIGYGGNFATGPRPGAESLVGVALVQLGVFAVLYYRWLVKISSSDAMRTSRPLLALFVLLLLGNSILQEEALAPSAVVIPFVLVGMAWRKLDNASSIQTTTK